MTATFTELPHDLAPEVIAAQKALELVPEEWRNHALDDSVLRRAAVQALHRALGERATMAEVRESVAVAAITKVAGGDMSGLDDLIHAQLEKDAATKLRSTLTVPDIDPAGLQLAFDIAGRMLDDSDRAISLPAVAFDAEMAAWRVHSRRTLGAPADPPMPTDLCRAASKRAAALARDCDEALRWTQNWRQWITATSHGDPLGLLASAAGVLEQRKALAGRVAETAKLIGQANRQRRDARLNWPPPGVNV